MEALVDKIQQDIVLCFNFGRDARVTPYKVHTFRGLNFREKKIDYSFLRK